MSRVPAFDLCFSSYRHTPLRTPQSLLLCKLSTPISRRHSSYTLSSSLMTDGVLHWTRSSLSTPCFYWGAPQSTCVDAAWVALSHVPNQGGESFLPLQDNTAGVKPWPSRCHWQKILHISSNK